MSQSSTPTNRPIGSVIRIGWIGCPMKFAELTGLRVLMVAIAGSLLGRRIIGGPNFLVGNIGAWRRATENRRQRPEQRFLPAIVSSAIGGPQNGRESLPCRG